MSARESAAQGIHAKFFLQRGSGRNGFTLQADVQLPSRGITAIFGESGSGKTTFLKLVAGLARPNRGYLSVSGNIWQNDKLFLPTHKRAVGYVFQNAGLLPHLSAGNNLNYARKRAGAGALTEEYDRIVTLMGIGKLLSRYPHQLSGGEQQRVAIARALLSNPAILLMDEPLASLDARRKMEILPYLERLRDRFDLPILYVTHSIDEVARLADHVLALDAGAVVAEGDVQSVFSRLDLPLRLNEDGGVVIPATLLERDEPWHLARVGFTGGELWIRDQGDPVGSAVRVRILARDVSLALSAHSDTSVANKLEAHVTAMAEDTDPALVLVKLDLGGTAIIARITRRSADLLKLRKNLRVWAQVKSAALVR